LIKQVYISFILVTVILLISGCKEDPVDNSVSLRGIEYNPQSVNLELPPEFPALEIPEDNPLTIDGVSLGQHLFFDPILSADSTMSCASCHLPEAAFTDHLAQSPGIDGVAGPRSSMSLVNAGFIYTGLFWDGRIQSLEEQALIPVEDPIELHHKWQDLIPQLRLSPMYQELFRKAFGIASSSEITKELAAKAIAQYERMIISGNSDFDKYLRQEYFFSDEEADGFAMFFDKDPDIVDAECFHCHSAPLITDNSFKNNGLDEVDDPSEFIDLGRGEVTGNPLDYGKFRVPTLRNITLTAPYMHDGRFETLEEVIDHYNSGGHFSPNKDPLIYPLGLSDNEKQNLIAFLHTLEDTSFLSNEYIKNPFN